MSKQYVDTGQNKYNTGLKVQNGPKEVKDHGSSKKCDITFPERMGKASWKM